MTSWEGLGLVGAVMDLAWAEQHLSAPPDELKQKLVRAGNTLAAAIDLKRKLIEELRPTLLDNVGLFAALRWHVQATCNRAGIVCTIRLPEDERRFLPNIPIGLFRIVQGIFAMIVTRKTAVSVDLSIVISRGTLSLQVLSDDGARLSPDNSVSDMNALTTVQYRIAALGGHFKYARLTPEGSSMIAQFPEETTLAPA